MARNLLKAGHNVRTYDVQDKVLKRISSEGAEIANSPADSVINAEFIFTMLPSGKEVFQAAFGDQGFAQSMSKETLLIDTSTILPADTDEISAKLADHKCRMIDAPVGRLAHNAIEGTLLFMVGGLKSDLERARPILNVLGLSLIPI